jgi:hypothetical protein
MGSKGLCLLITDDSISRDNGIDDNNNNDELKQKTLTIDLPANP